MKTGSFLLFFLLALLFTGVDAQACTTCNPPLQSAIFGNDFGRRLLFMVLPFVVLGLICYRLHRLK